MRLHTIAMAVLFGLASSALAQGPVCPLTGAEIPSDLSVCPATGLAPDAYSPQASVHWPLDADTGGFTAGEGVVLRVSPGEAGARIGSGCMEIDLSSAPAVGQGDMPPGVLLPEPPLPVHLLLGAHTHRGADCSDRRGSGRKLLHQLRAAPGRPVAARCDGYGSHDPGRG